MPIIVINYETVRVHRSRLEAFEQTCSVDQITSRCAGPPSACRESILGILGTMLRTNCACKDTSPSKFYDCMGWQRVFWFNSCVGKFYSCGFQGGDLPSDSDPRESRPTLFAAPRRSDTVPMYRFFLHLAPTWTPIRFFFLILPNSAPVTRL